MTAISIHEPSLKDFLSTSHVTVPGGRDLDDRPYILITIPPGTATIDIGPALKFILSVFNDRTRSRGFTIVLDARRGSWKVARACIRQVHTWKTHSEIARCLVLRPDAFWDKQRVEHCASAPKDGQVVFVQRSRLHKFVDPSQLPVELGGHFLFSHDAWLKNRLKLEEYHQQVASTFRDLDEIHMRLLNSHNCHASQIYHVLYDTFDNLNVAKTISANLLHKGKDLLQKVESDNRSRKFASDSEAMTTPQDVLDTIQRIGDILAICRGKITDIERTCKVIEKNCMDTKDISILEDGIVTVVNWIFGPAESLLNAHLKVGFDVVSAEQLRREHESLEFQCWSVYGTYAQLVHRIDAVTATEQKSSSSQQRDLMSQRDFMDFVCRSFANRLERRRNVLITSLRFFRLVSEYFDKTSEVFDSMVMGNKIGEFANAGQKLKELQDYQSKLDLVERDLLQQGDKLADMLSMPVKDSLGRDVSVNYSTDITNIRDILDATVARRNIFSDSVELQKMTLEQVVCIYGYERDAEQAVQWLHELLDVILKERSHVGCAVGEIQNQKNDQQVFEDTARCTYNYGCQLLDAAAALRQSCKLLTDDHLNLLVSLKSAWETFLEISQEQITRLRVSAIFHRSVEDHINRLRDLREAVATMPLMTLYKKQDRIKHFFALREKLLVEVGRMVRLGKLLRTRLKEPLVVDDKMSDKTNTTTTGESPTFVENATAVDAITERLAEITGLAEDLDQTLRTAQNDCFLASGTTIPITITSEAYKSELATEKPERSASGNLLSSGQDYKSDDEFLTASDCTPMVHHSRSSSYNTLSDCEHSFAPWWEHGARDDLRDDLSKEKLVLAVGCPDLPQPEEVLKPSPEVPPGKIAREVTETTHFRVQQVHTLGVKSFVLTSETVRDCKTSDAAMTTGTHVQMAQMAKSPVVIEKERHREVITDDDLERKLKEVRDDGSVWNNNSYKFVAKHANLQDCF